jgi:hypothetical protein
MDNLFHRSIQESGNVITDLIMHSFREIIFSRSDIKAFTFLITSLALDPYDCFTVIAAEGLPFNVE